MIKSFVAGRLVIGLYSFKKLAFDNVSFYVSKNFHYSFFYDF